MKNSLGKAASVAVLKSLTAAVAVCALEVRAGEDMVRIIPAGTFDAPRGAMAGQGPWQLDAGNAASVIARAAGRSVDIVIDYEHQTLMAEKNGKPAPAAGWIDPRSLEMRVDGLYGRVRWNAAAAQAVQNEEYRYLSPVFSYNPQTGEVLELLHVALTNTPAIDDSAITARAAARMDIHYPTNQEEDSVKREELIALLGLAADASDEQIRTGIAALKSANDQLAALRGSLGIDAKGDPVAAVAALKAGAADTVPKAVFDEVKQQLAVLKTGSETAEVEALIKEGLDDGRIAGKATADWLRQAGLAALKAHLKDAPSMAALKGATQTAGKKPEDGGDAELSQEEMAVCKSMGLTVDQFKAAKIAG